MQRFIMAATVLLLGAPALPSTAEEHKATTDADIRELATSFVQRLVKGKFARAVKDFDATMTKVMSAAELEETWKVQLGRYGALKKQLGSRVEKIGKYDVVHVACQFEKQTVDTRVVFNHDKQIAGLFFIADYEAPAYVRRAAFRERKLTVGTGEWALPGTLALPVGDGPFPAVVLVHGSGPHDRDESIGPNKPFRDLAWGLASRGIAVLRYEKRTKAHAAKLKSGHEAITVKEEVLDDALAAVALLRKTDKIDSAKVFVLGHSLGATCAPRLATLDPHIAGLICLAGTTRPLEEVIVEQLDYILSLGGHTDEQKKEMEKMRRLAAGLKGEKLTADTPAAKLPPGITAVYLLSLRECAPLDVARRIKQPMLILQGERDYQVTMTDFDGWKKALAARRNVSLKSYANLNHLFMEGKGKAKPAEYNKTGHVAAVVIDDIAEWVKTQGR
ncbi:MAG TPA: alpha/beta fold hydrolase [Gemmataceae bacterium]|nr:alpha/beta fold hydrolase [Gemmataceae bacterium]